MSYFIDKNITFNFDINSVSESGVYPLLKVEDYGEINIEDYEHLKRRKDPSTYVDNENAKLLRKRIRKGRKSLKLKEVFINRVADSINIPMSYLTRRMKSRMVSNNPIETPVMNSPFGEEKGRHEHYWSYITYKSLPYVESVAGTTTFNAKDLSVILNEIKDLRLHNTTLKSKGSLLQKHYDSFYSQRFANKGIDNNPVENQVKEDPSLSSNFNLVKHNSTLDFDKNSGNLLTKPIDLNALDDLIWLFLAQPIFLGNRKFKTFRLQQAFYFEISEKENELKDESTPFYRKYLITELSRKIYTVNKVVNERLLYCPHFTKTTMYYSNEMLRGENLEELRNKMLIQPAGVKFSKFLDFVNKYNKSNTDKLDIDRDYDKAYDKYLAEEDFSSYKENEDYFIVPLITYKVVETVERRSEDETKIERTSESFYLSGYFNFTSLSLKYDKTVMKINYIPNLILNITDYFDYTRYYDFNRKTFYTKSSLFGNNNYYISDITCRTTYEEYYENGLNNTNKEVVVPFMFYFPDTLTGFQLVQYNNLIKPLLNEIFSLDIETLGNKIKNTIEAKREEIPIANFFPYTSMSLNQSALAYAADILTLDPEGDGQVNTWFHAFPYFDTYSSNEKRIIKNNPPYSSYSNNNIADEMYKGRYISDYTYFKSAIQIDSKNLRVGNPKKPERFPHIYMVAGKGSSNSFVSFFEKFGSYSIDKVNKPNTNHIKNLVNAGYQQEWSNHLNNCWKEQEFLVSTFGKLGLQLDKYVFSHLYEEEDKLKEQDLTSQEKTDKRIDIYRRKLNSPFQDFRYTSTGGNHRTAPLTDISLGFGIPVYNNPSRFFDRGGMHEAHISFVFSWFVDLLLKLKRQPQTDRLSYGDKLKVGTTNLDFGFGSLGMTIAFSSASLFYFDPNKDSVAKNEVLSKLRNKSCYIDYNGNTFIIYIRFGGSVARLNVNGLRQTITYTHISTDNYTRTVIKLFDVSTAYDLNLKVVKGTIGKDIVSGIAETLFLPVSPTSHTYVLHKYKTLYIKSILSIRNAKFSLNVSIKNNGIMSKILVTLASIVIAITALVVSIVSLGTLSGVMFVLAAVAISALVVSIVLSISAVATMIADPNNPAIKALTTSAQVFGAVGAVVNIGASITTGIQGIIQTGTMTSVDIANLTLASIGTVAEVATKVTNYEFMKKIQSIANDINSLFRKQEEFREEYIDRLNNFSATYARFAVDDQLGFDLMSSIVEPPVIIDPNLFLKLATNTGIDIPLYLDVTLPIECFVKNSVKLK